MQSLELSTKGRPRFFNDRNCKWHPHSLRLNWHTSHTKCHPR